VKRGIHRTGAAAAIAAVAVGVPCAAWFVAGSHAARQEAARVEQAPVIRAREQAQRLARGLALRLEALRHSETRRPYTDYHVHDQDLEQDCACKPPFASPLVEGPTDPLVWTHFEIDQVGQLTLPTLAREVAPGADPSPAQEARAFQQAILERLECATANGLAAAERLPEPARELLLESGGEDWVVTVGPFNWNTLRLEQEYALVASREVSTPTAVLTQGFVVRAGALDELLAESETPATLRPGLPQRSTEALLPMEGDPWTVAVDASVPIEAAATEARRVRARFRKTFTGGLLAALAAGGLIVGMVWQAERLARQRARFAASAAHELRTPLAGLRLYGEMLAEGSGDPRRGKTYARRIAGEAERLGRVVSNLLGFSKMERGELRVNVTPGDLAAAVRGSIDQLRPALEAGGAEIELSLDEHLPAVTFDRDAVHQILQNLLDNADKYGGARGRKTIRVGLERASDGLRLSVTDRGPGVDPAVRRHLFEPFVRNPAPDAPPGLGLGLALVQALARAQGASVGYEHPSQGGSRFSVTFPAGPGVSR
jgi:signal transduction histidine kinase